MRYPERTSRPGGPVRPSRFGLGPSDLGSLALDAAGAACLALIARANLGKFDPTWDALYYHLPFAALRLGLTGPAGFVQRPDMAERLAGFPPVADLAQGLLWRAFHAPEAATLLPIAGIAALAIYVRLALGVAALWTVLVFLAVPILHTALDSGYVDLWTNAFFALHLLAGWRALDGARGDATHAGISAVSLAVAAESKPQFVALGLASAAPLITLLGARAIAARGRWRRGLEPSARPVALITFCVILPLAFVTPMRDMLDHANPFYPETVTVLGRTFKGFETNTWNGPVFLEHVARPVRYALSMLDVYAVDSRPEGYNLDQSGVAAGARSFRMGGSLPPLWCAALAVLAALVWRHHPDRWAWLRIAAFAALVALVACLPGSNELRYFSFVEIVPLLAVLAAAAWVSRGGDAFGAGAGVALRGLLVGGAVFMAAITGARHVSTRDSETLAQYMARNRVAAELDDALRRSRVVCYLRLDQNALLFSPLFHPDIATPFRLVAAFDPARCPQGSAVIR
jgi:hypothetical protein